MTVNPSTSTRRDPPTFQAERLLGSKTGLVEDLQFLKHTREFDDYRVATVTPTDVDRYETGGDGAESVSSSGVGGVTALGKGRSFEATLLGAVGEFVERYCGFWLPDADAPEVRRDSYAGLRRKGVQLPAFDAVSRYEPDQLRGTVQEPFTREAEVRWVPGTNLLDGTTVHAPQELVYLGEPVQYFATSSNGYACHGTPAEALLGSLYEYLERDALVDAWFRGRSPPRLVLDEFPDLAAERSRLETAHADIHLLALDSDADVDVVGAAYVDERDDAPKALVCAAAGPDFRTAVRDALAELAQGIAFVRWHLACSGVDGPDPGGGTVPDDRTMALGDNVRYYLDARNYDDLRPFLSGERVEPSPGESGRFDDPVAELRAGLAALDDAGCTPVAFDLTTDGVREVGFHVTKLFVPELLPLCRPRLPPRAHPKFDGESLVDRPHPIG